MRLPVTAAAFVEELTRVLAVMMCHLAEQSLIDVEFVVGIILAWDATVCLIAARNVMRAACAGETTAAVWAATAFPTAAK